MSRPRKRRRANGEGSIFRRSDGKWVGAITTGFGSEGQQLRKYYHGMTRAIVVGKLNEGTKLLAEGRDLSPERQTVAQFLDRWLKEVVKPNASPKTFRTYSDLVRLHVKPTIGGVDLVKLSPQQVQHLISTLAAGGLSPTTVKHCRATLRGALNVAMRWGLLVRNPATLVRLPRCIRRRQQVYNRAQARQFIETIRGHRLESLFLVALCMGMREGEVLGLGVGDLDLENRLLHVRHSLQRFDGKLHLVPTKTEESQREVRLPDLVASSLAAHLARQAQEKASQGEDWVETGRVFTTTKGTLLEARNMLREYYKLRDLSGLPKIRFQDLRHSAATLLCAAGIPMAAISKILGHSSTRTTQEVYAHVTNEMEAEAAAKMDAIFKPVDVTVDVKATSRKPQ